MSVSAPPQIGPQTGAPPSLENVPVALLQIDPAYQRGTDGPASRRIIASMVRCWDWKLYQPLTVARRADGSLFIIDGQHRHAAALQRGDIMFLPCALQSSLELAGEADTFVKLNTERQKLSQTDVFHAQLARGDAAATQLLALVEETGWRVRRGSTAAHQFEPGDLNCAPMLVKRLAAGGPGGGEQAVRFALTILRRAWPSTAVRSISTFLKALMEVPVRLGDDQPVTAEQVATTLATLTPDQWLLPASEVRLRNRALSLAESLAITIVRAIKEPLAAPVVPPPVAPPPAQASTTARANAAPASAPNPAPAAPTKRGDVFTLAGDTAWCSACKRRRTRKGVGSCELLSCQLKGSL